MSREEAAAKAIYVHNKAEGIDGFPADEYDCCAKEALTAADAHDAAHGVHRVSLDDATVERAARQLLKFSRPNHCDWDEWTPSGQRGWKEQARSVLAAAVEAGQ